MKAAVLIACEESATVRDAFRARGFDAYSCDLLPTRGDPEYHIQGDAIVTLNARRWDMLIAFPPCQFLCSSGLHWNKRIAGRDAKTAEAVVFATSLYNANIYMKCIENPIGRLNTTFAIKPQIIQPHQFGHDASKSTCLHLVNLPPLISTKHIAPRLVNGKPRWANQTDSGQNKLGPSPTRARDRAVTYQGVADAMAEQWGKLLCD